MPWGYKIQSPFQKKGSEQNPASLRQNLEEMGITTYQLNDKDIRVAELKDTMKRLQKLDDSWRGSRKYKETDKSEEVDLTFKEYAIKRCSLIAILAHIVAIPNGRGGNNGNYADKVILFNEQLGEFQLWQDSGVQSPLFLNLLYQESLSIVGYSWKEKDITVQKILVYINPMGLSGPKDFTRESRIKFNKTEEQNQEELEA